LEAAPDAIIVVNQSAVIALVNAQAEKLFGYSREELIGRPAKILVSEKFRDQHSQQHSRFLAGPQERPAMAGLELFGLRRDGTEFSIEIRLSPVISVIPHNQREVRDRTAFAHSNNLTMVLAKSRKGCTTGIKYR
jgi:PAS domain S-box-containing protein